MNTLHKLGLCALTTAASALPAHAQGALTTNVDVSSFGAEGNQDCYAISLSANGGVVGFSSRSTWLVPLDTNGTEDAFVHDLVTGVTERVSVSTAGVEGSYISNAPSLSADGRFAAFHSFANNLVPPVVVSFTQIYLRDRQLGTTELVSQGPTGLAGNSYCDRETSVSGDGRYVAFASSASNLVPGAGGTEHVYLRDRQLGSTELVSRSTSGVAGDSLSYQPTVSADGRFVVFRSQAGNLVAGDVNGVDDIFVRDRLLGTTTLVSLGDVDQPTDQDCLNPDISDDGRYVVFDSNSPWLVAGDANGGRDVFLRDRGLGTTQLVSVSSSGVQGNASSFEPSLSSDGRFLSFASSATNLAAVAGGPWANVYARDLMLGQTVLASLSSSGSAPAEYVYAGDISGDGRRVGYRCKDSILSPSFPASNSQSIRAFVSALPWAPRVARYCEAKKNSAGCWPQIGWSGTPTSSGPDDFHLVATNVLSQQPGILIWGTGGLKTPFSAAFLCVFSPERAGLILSGGNPPPSDCSGTYDFHVSQSFLAANGLGPGWLVFAQFWSRDPFLPSSIASGLTQGVHFVVE